MEHGKEEELLMIKLSDDSVTSFQEYRIKALQGKHQHLEYGFQQLESYDGGSEITLGQLKAVYNLAMRTSNDEKSTREESDKLFYERILKNSRITFPRHENRKEKALAQSLEKEEWRRRLRARSQQREYDRMVKNVHWGGPKNPDVETRGFYQASVGFNIMAAMVTAGFLGWYVAGSYFTKDAHRMVVAVISGMVMLIIEMVLYIIRTSEVDRFQSKRERNEELGRQGKVIPSEHPPQTLEGLFSFPSLSSQKETPKEKLL